MNVVSNIVNTIISEFELDNNGEPDFRSEHIIIDVTFPVSIIFKIVNNKHKGAKKITKLIIESMIIESKYSYDIDIESFIALLEYNLDLNSGYNNYDEYSTELLYNKIRNNATDVINVFDYMCKHTDKTIPDDTTMIPIKWSGDNFLNNMSLELILTQEDVDLDKPGLIF